MRRILLQHNFYRFVFLSVCQKCTSLILFIILGIASLICVLATYDIVYMDVCVELCGDLYDHILRVYLSNSRNSVITLRQLSYSGVLQLCKYNYVTLRRMSYRLHFKSIRGNEIYGPVHIRSTVNKIGWKEIYDNGIFIENFRVVGSICFFFR